MSEEEIYKGNVLIAKFMGYQILNKKYQTQTWSSSNESTWTWTEGEIVCDKNGKEVYDEDKEPYYHLEDLPFYTSWDLIMTVIKEIQSQYETEDSFGILIDISTTHIKISNDDFKYVDSKPQDSWICFDIKRVWKACVEYIKWYNNE